MAITWLADVLRDAGLTVVEHSGWKTRTVGGTWTPQFGIVHATAAPSSQTDTNQIRIVRDGREGLDGPIANACVDRVGRWHVLAAGRCNTTIAGTSGPYDGKGNTYALGVEACHNNLAGTSWPDEQYDAYVRGWAAIARKLGWGPDRLRGHKEHTPGHKTDPTFDMGLFRRRVAAVLAGEDNDVGTLEGDQAKQLAANTARTQAIAQMDDEIVTSWSANPTAKEAVPVVTTLRTIAADVAALKARPAAGTVTVSDEQLARVLEEVLRKIYGSVDGATPA